MSTTPNFPNYLQIPRLLPQPVWVALRIVSVCTAVGIALLLFLQPIWGLALFWRLVVPLLPIVFLVAPGLWRNVCPMAALNQVPRLFGFSRGLAHTTRIREYSYVVGIALFFLLVSSRKWLFDGSGTASGVLILSGLSAAFAGGLIFKGKSGWCSSICPMLPVQRLYGQTPLKLVGNAHCQPCVGCTKNCYDFNPKLAFLADQYDGDRYHAGYRRFFAAALPGFILAFFTMVSGAAPSTDVANIGQIYGHFLLYVGASLALFQALDTFAKVSANRLNVLFGALAFNGYYWFASVTWLSTLSDFTGHWAVPPLAPYAIRSALWVVTAVWLWKSFSTENLFKRDLIGKSASQAAGVGQGAVTALRKSAEQAGASLIIEPEKKQMVATEGQSLLDLIEGCGAKIESGCRMGVCGADPIAVCSGAEFLSPPSDDERNTLERLGHAHNTRMACSARVGGKGEITIALTPEKRLLDPKATIAPFDTTIRHVVVVGNGIAGVTAADHLRRRHPQCRITLLAEEKHHLYNRMAITRLVYGRSAMQGLYLMPESWYSDRKIDVMLNTAARAIHTERNELLLADGETLAYDRLILATGSNSFVPAPPGYGGAGCFVLRAADDAMAVRAYAQQSQANFSVVAGGGLLGLEAAYALHKLGLKVAVIERNKWLLHRQLDARAGRLLESYLTNLGLQILTGEHILALTQDDAGVQWVQMDQAEPRQADIFVVAAGIAPNTALAVAAQLDVKRGIVVGADMQTSQPGIYAVGDAAEVDGKVLGLWPVAVEQAEVAVANALGESRVYVEPVLSTQLKVVGTDLISVGRFEETPDDAVYVDEDLGSYRYRKLVVRDGALVGAIVIGWPDLLEPMARAVKAHRTLDAVALEKLNRADWSWLQQS